MGPGRWQHVLPSPPVLCGNVSVGDLLDLFQRSRDLRLWGGLWMVICNRLNFAGLVRETPRIRELQRQNWQREPGVDCSDRWAKTRRGLVFPTRGNYRVIYLFFLSKRISFRFKRTGVLPSRAAVAASPPWMQDNLALFDFRYAGKWIRDVIN